MITEHATAVMVEPVVNKVGHMLADKAKKTIKNTYNEYREAKDQRKLKKIKMKRKENQKRENSSLKSEKEKKYLKKMMKLVKNTRSPELYAELVREGIPMTPICLDALASVLQRPIEVTTREGEMSPFLKNPDAPKGKPIVLEFEPGENGNPGHFLSKDDTGNVLGRYDCILPALESQGIKVDNLRNKIADEILANPQCKEHIRLGIDKHFLKAGALGGDVGSTKTLKKKKKRLKENPEYSSKGREQGKNELFLTSQMELFRKLDERDKKAKKPRDTKMFGWMDLFLDFRTPIEVCLFEPKDGIPAGSGHPGATSNIPDSKGLQGSLHKGSHNYHNQLTIDEELFTKLDKRDTLTPEKAASKNIVAHLNGTATQEQIINMKIKKEAPVYSKKWGLDLSLKENRESLALASERSRYGFYKVLEKIDPEAARKLKNKPHCPHLSENDFYKKHVDKKISQVKNEEIFHKETLRNVYAPIMQKSPTYVVEAPGFNFDRK